MGVAKFINSVKESLGLDEFKKKGKKKSIKTLLKKLDLRKEKIEKKLSVKVDKKDKNALKAVKELNEELAIVSVQIKKGNKILDKLTTK